MAEWMILQSPAELLLLGAALFFNLFDRKYAETKGLFSVISCVLVLIACARLCLSGADLRELCSVCLVFLLLNIGERV